MPQGETFWNPYRLVPVRDQVNRRTPVTEEKFSGFCGTIACSLENLTLFFVGLNRQNKTSFLTSNQKFIIPGSSLKGMLRSLVELVGGGCMVTDQQRRDQYRACHQANSLCIACRLFGMLERGRNARVHQGQVAIGDALIREATPQTVGCQILLGNPSPRHDSFYRNPLTNRPDNTCRKLYFHQPQRLENVLPVPDKLKDRAETRMALRPGHHFDFTVQFNNLRREELALLLYVLVLEDPVTVTIGQEGAARRVQGPLRHKLGLGKPLGLGSVHIVINQLVLLQPPQQRFSSLTALREQIFAGDNLRTYIQPFIQPYINDQSDTMTYMRRMLVWDPQDPRDFHYPDYHWFKTTGNASIPLKTV